MLAVRRGILAALGARQGRHSHGSDPVGRISFALLPEMRPAAWPTCCEFSDSQRFYAHCNARSHARNIAVNDSGSAN
jgi:hypothetical protein